MIGVHSAWVVHGEGGYDEIAVAGTTQVAELRNGHVRTFGVEPRDFELESVEPETLVGGDRELNARIFRSVLAGEQGGPRTAVLLNAGAALVIAQAARTLPEGAARAAQAIDSGAAQRTLDAWVAASRGD
jgi:anthranilate phosphoribosyltransferase